MRLVLLLLLAVVSNPRVVLADRPVQVFPTDAKSGLVMAPGWQMVSGQCNACHSSLIVAQNRGDRAFWRETLQWMIDTQGLWDLSDTWEPTLDYLSTFYGPIAFDQRTFRRKPIDPALMPPPRRAPVSDGDTP